MASIRASGVSLITSHTRSAGAAMSIVMLNVLIGSAPAWNLNVNTRQPCGFQAARP
jgi:hypothetical protein